MKTTYLHCVLYNEDKIYILSEREKTRTELKEVIRKHRNLGQSQFEILVLYRREIIHI